MIHAFSADGKILRSFCPTFGVGLDDIDTHDEMAYASGRIDVHDDRIYFTQLAPQAIRVYTMDGDLIREFPRSPYGGGRPPTVRNADGSRTIRAIRGAVSLVVLPDGALLNTILVPPTEDQEAGSVIEHYDPNGDLIQVARTSTPLQPKTVDSSGHVWAVDNVPYGVVLRYPIPRTPDRR